MFAGLATLFLIMKLFNLEQQTELRFLNVLIVAFVSSRMVNQIAKHERDYSYLNTLFTLFVTNVFAVLLSVAGLVFYVKVIDPPFVESFQYWILLSDKATLAQVVGALIIEGSGGSVIVSLIVMQYYQYAKPHSIKTKPHKA